MAIRSNRTLQTLTRAAKRIVSEARGENEENIIHLLLKLATRTRRSTQFWQNLRCTQIRQDMEFALWHRRWGNRICKSKTQTQKMHENKSELKMQCNQLKIITREGMPPRSMDLRNSCRSGRAHRQLNYPWGSMFRRCTQFGFQQMTRLDNNTRQCNSKNTSNFRIGNNIRPDMDWLSRWTCQ